MDETIRFLTYVKHNLVHLVFYYYLYGEKVFTFTYNDICAVNGIHFLVL